MMNQNESDPLEEVENNIKYPLVKANYICFGTHFSLPTSIDQPETETFRHRSVCDFPRFLGLPSTAVAWHSVFRRQGV